MSILITTIGQRDVQLVQDNHCYPFDRFDLMKIQKDISENKIKTEWQPYKEGSNSLHQLSSRIKYDTIEQLDKIVITFPLLEKILKKVKRDLKSNKLQNLQKIFLYYTDRHEMFENCNDEELKRFIQMEPWYFAQLFQKHFSEIKNNYNLVDFPENIDLIKIDPEDNDINRKNIIPFLDNELRRKITYIDKSDPFSKVIVASSGGLPDVKNVIEEVCSLYFPDNCFFYDQDQKNDNIMHSIYHEYKKQAKERYELINRIENWDFTAAYGICSKPSSFVNSDSDIYALIELAHEWLSGDPEAAAKICDDLMKMTELEAPKKLFASMKKMICDFNYSSPRSLIRLMHLYRINNYWGAATVFITAIENLCIQFIKHVFPDSYVSVDEKSNGIIFQKFYFDKNKISNFEPAQNLFRRYSDHLLMDDWRTYEAVLDYIAANNENQNADYFMKTFMRGSSFFDFKNEQRNEFIHKGDSLKKQKLDELLFAKNLKPDFYKEDLNSSLLAGIIKIYRDLKLDFVNWLPQISNLILEELNNTRFDTKE